MEFCQPGISPLDLPHWCVSMDVDKLFIIQGILELLILVLVGIIFSRMARQFKTWIRKKLKKKEDLSKWEPYS